ARVRSPHVSKHVLKHQHQRKREQELETVVAAVDGAQQALDRRADEAERNSGDQQPRHDQPGRKPGGEGITHDAHSEIGTERVDRAAGKIEDLLHPENELQPGGNQEQDGGVKHAAEENIGERDHPCTTRPQSSIDARCDSALGDQTLNLAVLIQSQKLAPGGFCRSLAYIVSRLPCGTESYLFVGGVLPCTKVFWAVCPLPQDPLPRSLPTDSPAMASITSSWDGQLPFLTFAAFSTAALYEAMAKYARSASHS